jgi:hypothetical protein
MILILCLLQWLLCFAILVVAFRHSYRAGRITRFAVCFTWISFTLVALAFVMYTFSFSRAEREQWANWFFEVPHVLAFAVFGWMQGLLVTAIGAGIGRIIRRQPLFPFLAR